MSTNWTRVTVQSSSPYLVMSYPCMTLNHFFFFFCNVGRLGGKFKDSWQCSRHPILDSPINLATNNQRALNSLVIPGP
jgi:hypothetical protein